MPGANSSPVPIDSLVSPGRRSPLHAGLDTDLRQSQNPSNRSWTPVPESLPFALKRFRLAVHPNEIRQQQFLTQHHIGLFQHQEHAHHPFAIQRQPQPR